MPNNQRVDTYRLPHRVKALRDIVEHWVNSDDLGMLRQLGAIPAPEQAAA